MSEAIEKVARAIAVAAGVHDERLDKDWPLFSGYATAAVNCLADNVTDEMVMVGLDVPAEDDEHEDLRNSISAALKSISSQP